MKIRKTKSKPKTKAKKITPPVHPMAIFLAIVVWLAVLAKLGMMDFVALNF